MSVKSYLATTIVLLPLYFPIEKAKNEIFLGKKNDSTVQQYPSSKSIFIFLQNAKMENASGNLERDITEEQ